MDLFQMLIGLSGSLHPLANSDFFNAPSKTGDSDKDEELYREARRRKVVESMGSRFTQEMVRIISSEAPAILESGRNQDPNVQREILLLKIHVERSNA